jgi:hypothetical protein
MTKKLKPQIFTVPASSIRTREERKYANIHKYVNYNEDDLKTELSEIIDIMYRIKQISEEDIMACVQQSLDESDKTHQEELLNEM